jgi:LppP/LprE lipoprotein
MRRVGLVLVLGAALTVPASAALSGGGLKASVKVVRSKGYCAPRTSTWEAPSYSKFNVLVAVNCKYLHGSGAPSRAFFFYRSHLIGTDAPNDSTTPPQQVWRDGSTIALLYILWRKSDFHCCPTGGGAIVRFHRKGNRVVPLDRVPPRAWTAALGR